MSEEQTEKTWRIQSMGGGNVTETNGEETRDREITREERWLIKQLDEFIMKDMHGIWWAFQELLSSGDKGYDLGRKCEEFAEANPGWVSIGGVDDDHHTCSDMVFVRHGTGENYMGLSAVYIPQNSYINEQGYATFFMYPGNVNSVMSAIAEVDPYFGGLKVLDETDGGLNRWANKPSQFDAFDDHWKSKPWYTTMGFELKPIPEDFV